MSITDRQRYLFDLRGYIVLEDVISQREIANFHRVIDRTYVAPPNLNQENCYRHDFLSWDPSMLDLAVHPLIIEWMHELCGPHIRLDHAYFYHMRYREPEHLHMHGNGSLVDHSQFFFFKNGRMHNGLCVVSIALNDIHPGDGGFCCVPGSHKSNYAPPFDPSDQTDPVVHVPVKAGSAVIFTEALRHGTMIWQSKTERRGLFYKYAPSSITYADNYANQWTDLLNQLPQNCPAEKRSLFQNLLSGPRAI